MSERKQDPLKLPRLARDLFGTRIDARAESENGITFAASTWRAALFGLRAA